MGLQGCGSALSTCWQSLSTLNNYGFTLLLLLVSVPSRVLLGQGTATADLWASFEPWALVVLLGAKGRSVKVPAGGNQQSGAVFTWASVADGKSGLQII